MSRLGFLVLRDGSIEVQDKNKPELAELKGILNELEFEYDIKAFEKPDYFAPFPFIEGVVNSNNYRT